MDVSVIVPLGNCHTDLGSDLPVSSWPGCRLQILLAQCDASRSRLTAPSRLIQQWRTRDAEAELYHIGSRDPGRVLATLLPHCRGQIVAWQGGDYPPATLRWLVEATSRYDFVCAQPRTDLWRRSWSRVTRWPRRLWSGHRLKHPRVQMWAGLKDAFTDQPILGPGFSQLPEQLERSGFRVGVLITPYCRVRNVLEAPLASPLSRWRKQRGPHSLESPLDPSKAPVPQTDSPRRAA